MPTDDLDRLLARAESSDWSVRAGAIRALRDVCDPRAEAAIVRALRDGDLAVVEVATAALLESHRGLPLLEALLGDEEIATFVGDLLADASSRWFEDYLSELLLSEHVPLERRVAAAETLGFVLEARRALPALSKAAESPQERLSAVARGAVDRLSALES
jgi:HEAT repeat protein